MQRVRNGAVRQLRVLNLHRNVGIDREAKRVVDIAVDPRRHPGLNQKISNYLLGFDASTQGYMADFVIGERWTEIGKAFLAYFLGILSVFSGCCKHFYQF